MSSNCDKALKKSNCDKTQNLNCDKTKIATKLNSSNSKNLEI